MLPQFHTAFVSFSRLRGLNQPQGLQQGWVNQSGFN